MDTEELVIPLSDSDKAIGAKATKCLAEHERLGVRAIFWWFDTESHRWRLAVASRAYREGGPRLVYTTIRNLLETNDLLAKLPLERVWAIEDRHYILESIYAVATPTEGMTIQNGRFRGLPVAGAHFLFVSPKKADRTVGARRET